MRMMVRIVGSNIKDDHDDERSPSRIDDSDEDSAGIPGGCRSDSFKLNSARAPIYNQASLGSNFPLPYIMCYMLWPISAKSLAGTYQIIR